jgi:hypothetical protein
MRQDVVLNLDRVERIGSRQADPSPALWPHDAC